jgi:aspartate oxidase
MVTAASAIVEAATRRKESRGAHFRADFPAADAALDGQHLVLTGGAAGRWRFGSLSNARDPVPAGV